MKIQFALALLFVFFQTQAQTLEGSWKGHYLTSMAHIPENATFRWDAENWGFYFNAGETWTSFHADLQIAGDYPNLTGTYLLLDKSDSENWGSMQFTGNFDFASKKMVWQLTHVLEGTLTVGKNKSRPFAYSQEGAYEYLRGRWKTESGYNCVVELRRSYSGTPLQEKKPQPVQDTLFEYSEMNFIGFEFPRLWDNSRNDETFTFTSIKPDNSMLFSLQRANTSDEKYLQNNLEPYLSNVGVVNPQWKSAAQINLLQGGLAISKEVRYSGHFANDKVEILVRIAKTVFSDNQQMPILIICLRNKTAGTEQQALIDRVLGSYKQVE